MRCFPRQYVSLKCSRPRSLKAKMVFEEPCGSIKFFKYIKKLAAEIQHMLQQLYSERTLYLAKVFSKNTISRMHKSQKICDSLTEYRPVGGFQDYFFLTLLYVADEDGNELQPTPRDSRLRTFICGTDVVLLITYPQARMNVLSNSIRKIGYGDADHDQESVRE